MNRKSITLVIFALSGYITCFSQKLPTKVQQYAFLQWYINNKQPKKLSPAFQYVEGPDFQLDDFDELKDTALYRITSSEFKITDNDKAYFKQQITHNYKNGSIDEKLLLNVDWKTKSDPDHPITYLSLPIFSIDGNLAFINTSYYCGSHCGEGGIEIYRKVNGGWQRYEIRFWAHWVS